jgi:hypothetical protein
MCEDNSREDNRPQTKLNREDAAKLNSMPTLVGLLSALIFGSPTEACDCPNCTAERKVESKSEPGAKYEQGAEAVPKTVPIHPNTLKGVLALTDVEIYSLLTNLQEHHKTLIGKATLRKPLQDFYYGKAEEVSRLINKLSSYS